MIQKKLAIELDSPKESNSGTQAAITMFAIPKPFDGHIGTIQRNAIRSWAELRPHVEIILFGQNDPELDKIAGEVGARVLSLKSNESGTPVLSDAFAAVHSYSSSQMICYANSDIVFGSELLDVADELKQFGPESFLGIGQRINLTVTEEIGIGKKGQFDELIQRALDTKLYDSVVCKDYFLFSANLFCEIPAFLVGRGNWDNWMVASAKSNGTPVIDLTARLPAIHQDHDYSHVPGGRKNAYVFGFEARENQRLAGGRKLLYGSTATWELTEKGIKKRRFPKLVLIRDIPKFITLVRNLTFLGYMVAGTALTI